MDDKREIFAREYLKDLNATQAAIRAGYSKKTAHVQGPRLLQNAAVKALVDKLKQQRNERLETSADKVIRELCMIAHVDIGEIFTEDGKMKPLSEIKPEVRRAMAGLEVEDLFDVDDKGRRKRIGLTKKVKMNDKIRALELLAKHFKILGTDPAEAVGGFAEALRKALERAEKAE